MTDKEKKLEHPKGGSTTKDATDLGVPMGTGEGPQGPEDALEENTRGDYRGRLGEGESYTLVQTGTNPDGSPIIERVRQK